MLKNQIVVGGHYVAKVGTSITTVRVDAIREVTVPRRGYYSSSAPKTSDKIVYDVTNLRTGRKTTFRSAMKFRSVAKPTVVTSRETITPVKAAALLATPGEGIEQAMERVEKSGNGPADVYQLDEEGNEVVEQLCSSDGTVISQKINGKFVDVDPATERAEDDYIRQTGRIDAVENGRLIEFKTTAKPASFGLARQLAQTDDSPHVECPAFAGTGKTTTVIEGCKEAKGVRSGLTPSDEQRAVWTALATGKHDSIRISSFASKITDELKGRVEACGLHRCGVEARGIHSLGLQAATQRFGRLSANDAKWVVVDIACGMIGKPMKEMRGTPDLDVVWAVDKLVSLCKQTLVEPTAENLDHLTSRYDVDLDLKTKSRVYGMVPAVLEACKIPQGGRIAFDDMIWLPLVHDLPISKVDLQIVDESQDLNRMQQELIYRAGHRICFVGDKRQAIYGFAGADSESMDNMRQHLASSRRGVVTIPLTVTRRCGKAIVQEAQQYVPTYRAHESNCVGLVDRAGYEEGKTDQYRRMTGDGDMVLCRVNAPLVSQCFRFIKEGRKANILGRKVGEGLVALVEKSKKQSTLDLIAWLGDWLAKEQANENAKKYPSEGRLDNLQDRYDCLVAFTEGLSEVSAVVRKINSVFTDNKDAKGVNLSSIHKAKGLEARRVFILQPKGVGPRMDKMQEWELEQEDNLRYVAITRAIEELRYVS